MTLVNGTNVPIGHLGIVARVYDTLEIGRYIDEVIPKTRHNKVTHGMAFKALSLNGQGYNESRPTLMPDFFENMATERMLGKGILPYHLNEYVFGETLDAIAAYGPTRLVIIIVLRMMDRLLPGVQRVHHDTTSISLTSEYDNEFKTRINEIVLGHSKDQRDDLKQFVISPVTNHDGIPVFMEPWHGNNPGKKDLARIYQSSTSQPCHETNNLPHGQFHIYTVGNIQSLVQHCYWISHVPLTITEAQSLVVLSAVSWTACEDTRYKFAICESSYGEIPQKWAPDYSAEQQKRVDAKFTPRLEKQMKKDKSR